MDSSEDQPLTPTAPGPAKDNERLLEVLAEIALSEGRLGPLIKRVKARKWPTEDEWKIIEQVLEAAGAGRFGWHPPNRPPHSEARRRRTAYSVLYHYNHARLAYSTGGGQPVFILSHRNAVKQLAAMYRARGQRCGESRVEQYLGIARRDPKIMGDPTIKGQIAAFEAAVSKEIWTRSKRRATADVRK